MKLNYRDKILLLVVFVIAVWAVGIMFFIKPAIEDVSSAQDERDNLKTTLSEKQETIERDKNIKNETQASYDKANENSKCFYDYMVAQQASQMIDEYLDELGGNKITNLNMEVSDYSSKALTPYSFLTKRISISNDEQINEFKNAESNASSATDSSADSNTASGTDSSASNAAAASANTDGTPVVEIDQTVACYTITVEFHGNYDDLKTFCEKLTTNTEKSLVITEMTINHVDKEKNQEEAKQKSYDVEGSITFDMMMMRKLPPLDLSAS